MCWIIPWSISLLKILIKRAKLAYLEACLLEWNVRLKGYAIDSKIEKSGEILGSVIKLRLFFFTQASIAFNVYTESAS